MRYLPISVVCFALLAAGCDGSWGHSRQLRALSPHCLLPHHCPTLPRHPLPRQPPAKLTPLPKIALGQMTEMTIFRSPGEKSELHTAIEPNRAS